MHDRVAPLERAFDGRRVGHVADDGLDSVDAERAERGRDLLRRPGQDPDPMPGSGQRRDRVRAEISGPPGNQHQHCHAPPDILPVNRSPSRAGITQDCGRSCMAIGRRTYPPVAIQMGGWR